MVTFFNPTIIKPSTSPQTADRTEISFAGLFFCSAFAACFSEVYLYSISFPFIHRYIFIPSLFSPLIALKKRWRNDFWVV
ncbi:hypothetical protein Hanom_Chr03g00253921 [Helianthus anomalus]